MSSIKIENISDEIQYRLARLKTMIPEFDKKRVVVYGTGINTKRVLDCLRTLNVLGLMDEKETGKYVYGKKVLTSEEIQLLKVDIILIAAEPQSTEIVYNRIFLFCIKNNISLINMYGWDEFQLHKNILEQELVYPQLKEEDMKKKISANDVLLFPFRNVLCSEIISDDEKLYEKMEEILKDEGFSVPNFKRNRIMAQKRVPVGLANMKEIYKVLLTMLVIDEERIEKIRRIEERVTLENLVPRKKILELLKYAILEKKEVYIYSDILNGEILIDSFLKLYGIGQYKKILASKDSLPSLLGRTIRALGDYYGNSNVLCLGNNISDNLIIPQLYHVNFQLIQSSYDMFLETTKLHVDQEFIENNSDRDEIKKSILQAYESPFFNQINLVVYDNIIAEKVGWHEQEAKIELELLPMREFDMQENFDKLLFQKEEVPLVSIIIPVYNQFEYTYNCLQSILLNTDNVSYEVILADDCSNDLTVKIEEIVSGIHIIHNKKNLVFVKNCNYAAKVAKGKYLVFLNNDTQVQLNWLYPLVKYMENNIDVGLIGSKLVYPDGSLQEAGSIIWDDATAWNYGTGKYPDLSDYNYVREVDYISGAAIMISKSLWDEIGGFDERYSPAYYEDADLAFEVRKHGKKVIYQPDSVVVHFEGISNGKNIESGIKKYQRDNQKKFFGKWKEVLNKEQYTVGEHVLGACDRKQKRKTVLFISEHVPTYDQDAGSKTLDFYIQEFIQRGYIVKFLPSNFIAEQPYTYRLEQMGVQVLAGKYYQKAIDNWLYEYHKDIDFAFLNYPNASKRFIDVLKRLGIPTMYYGVDLHYLRLQREAELFKDKNKEKEARIFYETEKYLIENSDVVYYPSQVETEIVKREFKKNNVKQLMINIYDIKNFVQHYVPAIRDGIMFIGGYKHTPNVDAVMWFTYHIFPKIYKRLKIPFYIAGVNMPVDISNIDMEGTIKLGALSDMELEKMYNKVKMIVVPLRYGAGIKGKVIEAMYHGVPVVTTSIGIEGIPNDEEGVKIANDEEDFADAVIHLYQSEEELKKMSTIGQNVIKKYYSREAAWANIAEDFM